MSMRYEEDCTGLNCMVRRCAENHRCGYVAQLVEDQCSDERGMDEEKASCGGYAKSEEQTDPRLVVLTASIVMKKIESCNRQKFPAHRGSYQHWRSR